MSLWTKDYRVLWTKLWTHFWKPFFFQDINSKWNEVKTLVPQRDQTLQDELRKQQNNEALRRQFADKANQVGPWIEKQMDAVSAIGMGMQVSSEEDDTRRPFNICFEIVILIKVLGIFPFRRGRWLQNYLTSEVHLFSKV